MIEQEIRDLLATCIRELRKDYKKMTSNDIYYDMGYIHALYRTLSSKKGFVPRYLFRLRDSKIEGTKFLFRVKIWCMICRMVGLVLRVAMNTLKTL